MDPPKGIRLAGGVAKSAVWTQMFAYVMNLPFETVCEKETGALGCAIIAATSSGAYTSLPDAAARMCRISEPFLPDKTRAMVSTEKYGLYRKTLDALDPIWDTIQAYKDG